MRVAWLLFCIYGLSFSTAHASTLADLSGGSTTCSGSLSLDAINGLNFSCSGDLSLSAGSFTSDTGIILSSLGSLTLDAFTLSAPNITLNAASIFLKSNASLTGHNINISAGNPSANSIILDGQVILLDAPGGGISIGSSGNISIIPLPASFTLLLTGLLSLLSLSGRSLTRKSR